VPHGVAGQVHDDPLHELRVRHDLGKPGRDAHRDRTGANVNDRPLDDVPQRGRPGEHRQLARLQPAHVQQGRREARELVQGLIDDGQQLTVVVGGQRYVRG
jgi:hypothetical protein